MPRNENFIEGGMSSAAQRRLDAKVERRKRLEEDAASRITPGIQMILDWIDEEMNEVCDLRQMVLHVADKDLARDELIARKLHMEFLEKLKGRAQKVIRVADRHEKQARNSERALKKELEQDA